MRAKLLITIVITVSLALLSSCGAYQRIPTNDIQSDETELSVTLGQAPSGHLAHAAILSSRVYQHDGLYDIPMMVKSNNVLVIISIDEPLYTGKEIYGLYVRVGTYTYTRADEKGTPQTAAAFIRKEEFQKYGTAYLKEYFPNVEFFIKEPQPQENQN